MKISKFSSSEGNVWKYVFEFADAITEAVLYRYESFYKRTVLCVSVQSGCPVGCKFCGTGRRFIRNLTSDEIVAQVESVLADQGIEDVNHKGERFQIMFMSMGEPLLNFENVEGAIRFLHSLYPNAELLLSTMAPKNPEGFKKLVTLSTEIPKVGLQFSIHEALDEKRDELIPFKNKFDIRTIRDLGLTWNKATGRPVYVNYCVGPNNQSNNEMDRLKDLFSPLAFAFTFSVICSPDETMKEAGYRNMDKIQAILGDFLKDGYNVRMFDPAGQDDIGGGCGQLWYVQEWLKNRANNP